MKAFNNMPVRKRLLVSFFVVICFVLILAAVGIYELLRMDSKFSYQMNSPQKRVEILTGLSKNISDMRLLTTAIAINVGDKTTIDDIANHFNASFEDANKKIDLFVDNSMADSLISSLDRDGVVASMDKNESDIEQL